MTAWPCGSRLPLHVPGALAFCTRTAFADQRGLTFTVGLGTPPDGKPGGGVLVSVGQVLAAVTPAKRLVVEGFEPFLQPAFTSALIHVGAEHGLHTELVTSGHFAQDIADRSLGEPALLNIELAVCGSERRADPGDAEVLLRRVGELRRPVRVQLPVAREVVRRDGGVTTALKDVAALLRTIPTLSSVEVYPAPDVWLRPPLGPCRRKHLVRSGTKSPSARAVLTTRSYLIDHGVPVE